MKVSIIIINNKINFKLILFKYTYLTNSASR